MKKTFKTIVSFVTISVMILSLASCNFIKAIMEGVEPDPIQGTPSEEEIVSEFNKMLANSISESESIKENISYSAGNPDVFAADGSEAGLLDAAAGQLKTFIMEADPGSEGSWVKSAPKDEKDPVVKEVKDTLLKDLNADYIFSILFNRDITTENVTDEKDKEVMTEVVATNEAGEEITQEINVTTTYESNNALHMTFNYFETKLASEVEAETEDAAADTTAEAETSAEAETTEAETTEAEAETTEAEASEKATDEASETAAEEETEPETVYIYADDEVIVDVFGDKKNEDEVLKNFENIADYIVVKDYSVEYESCKITSDADLYTDTLSFVNFEKNMKVTATAECVGELASYGEITITFNLTKTTNYTFNYPEEEVTDSKSEAVIKETTVEA